MTYEAEWDLPHLVEAASNWQESDCYWFFDRAAGVGGWHRIGQYCNQGLGQSSIFLYEIGGQRFLDRTIEVPGELCSRCRTGQTVGKSIVECLSPQVMRYRYDAEAAAVDLTFGESFYQPRDWTSASHGRATEKGHLEVGGRIRGNVRLGGNTFAVDALAHRDRSWGPRNLAGMDVLWFCNGTTGQELSWAAMRVRLAGGNTIAMGYLVRNGLTQDLSGIEANVLTAVDGVTPLRAFLRLSTSSERVDLDVRTNQGFVQQIAPGPFIVVDHSSTVWVEGREGFADFGIVQNAFRGEHLPNGQELSLTCAEDGLSSFSDHGNAMAAFNAYEARTHP